MLLTTADLMRLITFKSIMKNHVSLYGYRLIYELCFITMIIIIISFSIYTCILFKRGFKHEMPSNTQKAVNPIRLHLQREHFHLELSHSHRTIS